MNLGESNFSFGSAGGGGGGGGTNTAVLNFLVGDGGSSTPPAGQPIFNPATNPLVGGTVLGMFGGGLFISPTSDAAVGDLSWAFVSGTGILTLSNGNFDNNTTYSIWYIPSS